MSEKIDQFYFHYLVECEIQLSLLISFPSPPLSIYFFKLNIPLIENYGKSAPIFHYFC